MLTLLFIALSIILVLLFARFYEPQRHWTREAALQSATSDEIIAVLRNRKGRLVIAMPNDGLQYTPGTVNHVTLLGNETEIAELLEDLNACFVHFKSNTLFPDRRYHASLTRENPNSKAFDAMPVGNKFNLPDAQV